MANLWTYDQRFNGLPDGDLNGVNGWTVTGTGASTTVTTADSPYEGTKHIKVMGGNPSDQNNSIKTFTGIASGTVHFSVKMNQTNLYTIVKLLDSNDAAFVYFPNNHSTIYVYDHGSFTDTGIAWTSGVYYRISVAFECGSGAWENLSADHYKISVNGSAWTAEYGFTNAQTSLTKFQIVGEPLSTSWFDFISPNYLVPSTNTYQVKTGAGLTGAMSYGGDQTNHTETRVAQSFYTKEKGILTSIDIYSCKGGSPTDLSYYDIYASDGLKPTGSPLNLTRGVISNSSLITQPTVAVYHIPVVTSELASETQYWMVASRSGADDGTNYPVVVSGGTYTPLPFVQYNGSSGLWGSDTHQAWNIVFNFQKSTTPSLTNTNSLALVAASSQYATGGNYLDNLSAFTVESWIKTSTRGGTTRGIVTKASDNSSGVGWMIYENASGKIEFLLQSDAGAKYIAKTSTNALDDGTWHHIAFVWSGGAITLYVDGSVDAGTDASSLPLGSFTNAVNVEVGQFSANAANHYFDGLIDDTRLWSDVRTAQEIFDNYRKQLIGNEAGLVAYWQLNGNANDATANANNLTLVGSPAYSTTVPFTHQTDIFYSQFGDGRVYSTDATWAIARGKFTGDNADYASYQLYCPGAQTGYYIFHAYFPFDTSALGSSAGIISAALYFNIDTKADADSSWINLYQSFQASPSALVLDDFGKCNSTAGATQVNVADLTENSYNALTLNSDGIRWINTTGYTLLCLRGSNEMLNVAPTGNNRIMMNFSKAGIDHCPYLAITYGPVSTTLTGTITESTTKSNIVAGGKTIILTMNGDTWTA